MAHQNPELNYGMGSRGRGLSLQSLPGSDSTAHDSSEGYTLASPDPFHTLKNNTHASTEAGLRREKSEALLNNDWRHNRRPRAQTEALPPVSELGRASHSLRQQPRMGSDILDCGRIRDTPVDPEMIKSAPGMGWVGMLLEQPHEVNNGHGSEEAPIRLDLDSLEESGYVAVSHTRSIDEARGSDEISIPGLLASFAVKPFDDSQQDSRGSLSCLLRRNSKLQRFKARDWNTFAEEEWALLSNATAKSQPRLPSACRRKDGQKNSRFEDDARYKACILDKLQKKSVPGMSGFEAKPDCHTPSEAARKPGHGERQKHRSHVSNGETGRAAATDATKDFKWNPNAPEFATCPPLKPPPATISCSDPSRARPLMGAFDPAPMPGALDLAAMPGAYDPVPMPGGFGTAPTMGGFDTAPTMGGFDFQLPRGAFGAGNDYSPPAEDHAEGTIAGTCARLRSMLDQLEVTAANQAERDRYLNTLSRMLLPGAAPQIPGLQTLPSTQNHTGLQTHPAADGAFPPRTTIPFGGLNSRPCPESGASSGAGMPLPSVGSNIPFHAAPLPASTGTAPDPYPNGSVSTFTSFSNSSPVHEHLALQPNGSLSGVPQHNGSRQSNTFPSRRGRGAASDPVPCHPIFGPKPVEKPKGPPRPHDPLWNRQQQMYEAWLEWQRSVNPARHLEGKERQNKRNERRMGSRRSGSELATKDENTKPWAQVTEA